MTYEEKKEELLKKGFTRVERDDRLLDIYPKETREKGIELWQKWEEKEIKIIKLREPFGERKQEETSIKRSKIEQALLKHKELILK